MLGTVKAIGPLLLVQAWGAPEERLNGTALALDVLGPWAYNPSEICLSRFGGRSQRANCPSHPPICSGGARCSGVSHSFLFCMRLALSETA